MADAQAQDVVSWSLTASLAVATDPSIALTIVNLTACSGRVLYVWGQVAPLGVLEALGQTVVGSNARQPRRYETFVVPNS